MARSAGADNGQLGTLLLILVLCTRDPLGDGRREGGDCDHARARISSVQDCWQPVPPSARNQLPANWADVLRWRAQGVAGDRNN